MTREMTHEELQKVIEQHKHWWEEDCDGWEDMRADLYEADLDYSCLPLWCGSLEANFG